jgi:GTP pyrophosphokinase/guanosine-3',5'-bis(diphosphate) 3'-pyrophosphohydrolase
MKTRETFLKLFSSCPALKKNPPGKINKEIFNYLLLFVNDKDILLASLVQNPFGKTSGLGNIKKNFGEPAAKIISQLNAIHDGDRSVLKKYPMIKKIIILYLANFAVLFNRYPKDPRSVRATKAEKITFAMKLLENLDITEIRTQLEDRFFAILYPAIYANYHSLLGFTRKEFLLQQKKITQEFKKILYDSKIEARIESRLKTIYSIHHKITKKNILFSQILDTIGLRIIVKTEDDCYRTMVLMLKNNPILTSRVKDYIAIPKENGYQSIHLTILHDGHPVEIQIRTEKMNLQAQYGLASHFKYKRHEENNDSKRQT